VARNAVAVRAPNTARTTAGRSQRAAALSPSAAARGRGRRSQEGAAVVRIGRPDVTTARTGLHPPIGPPGIGLASTTSQTRCNPLPEQPPERDPVIFSAA